MTDKEMQTLAGAIAAMASTPLCEICGRLLTLIEHLTARVETLELEVLHRREPPAGP